MQKLIYSVVKTTDTFVPKKKKKADRPTQHSKINEIERWKKWGTHT